MAERASLQAQFASIRRWRALQRILRASSEELERIQLGRLSLVMEAAGRTEPYRRLHGDLVGRRIKRVADLFNLPVVDRVHLASFPFEDRMASQPERIIRHSTSGTTGTPIQIAWSGEEDEEHHLILARQLEAQGVTPNSEPFFVNVIHSRQQTEIATARGRRTNILKPASAASLAEEIKAAAPTVLWGEPSILMEIADVLGCYPVKTLITDSEVLDPEARHALTAAFAVSPLDVYDSYEGGFVSWQCAVRSGYHINADVIVVEVVDDRGRPLPRGEPGDVVITNLWNLTTPFIRYRTGDAAALLPGPCPCGMNLPLMSQVEGRKNDWIVTRDGTRLSPFRVLISVLLGVEWGRAVRRYGIVQRAVDDFLIRVEWKAGRRNDLIERIAPAYTHTMGYPVRVEVQDVDQVPRAPSGKFRLVESSIGRASSGKPETGAQR